MESNESSTTTTDLAKIEIIKNELIQSGIDQNEIALMPSPTSLESEKSLKTDKVERVGDAQKSSRRKSGGETVPTSGSSTQTKSDITDSSKVPSEGTSSASNTSLGSVSASLPKTARYMGVNVPIMRPILPSGAGGEQRKVLIKCPNNQYVVQIKSNSPAGSSSLISPTLPKAPITSKPVLIPAKSPIAPVGAATRPKVSLLIPKSITASVQQLTSTPKQIVHIGSPTLNQVKHQGNQNPVTISKTSVFAGTKITKVEPSPLVTIEKRPQTALLGSRLIAAVNKSLIQSKNPESLQRQSLLIKSNEHKIQPSIVKDQSTSPKQESLLKNKTLDLEMSPRTKRSQSLNLDKVPVQNRQRTQSSSSERAAGDVKIQKQTVDKVATISESKVVERAVSIEKKVFPSEQKDIAETADLEASLLCNENIVNANVSPETFPIKVRELRNVGKPERPNFSLKTRNTESPPHFSPSNLLQWQNGIGLLKNSKIKFQKNEFGLIEVYEKSAVRDRVDIAYEKPIYEREASSETSDYSDPLYYCRACNCHGAAVDFLAPEFCSVECVKRFNRQKFNSNRGKIRMKIMNEMRPKVTTVRRRYAKTLDPDEIELEETTDMASLPVFSWSEYLTAAKAEPAWIDLFLNPFPCGPNLFEIGMKLEAIDPEHSSMFCVSTIVDKKGYRLKLNFDGYSKIHDFWVNADSMDIFPPGWCAKTNRNLIPPKHINPITFNWPTYLNRTRAIPAPRHLFTHLNSSSTTNPFTVGMKLEADDIRNTRKVCVATIADILDNRVLIHFDGWDESYDFWVDICSPYIHPINWHKKNGFEIVTPPDWDDDDFDWMEYLAYTRSEPALDGYFQTRDPIGFLPGMKLEVVDKKNPSLIRPATILVTEDYEVKVLFQGWSDEYAYWVSDDSPDIHPVGWCELTGHELEPPPGYKGLPVKMPCPTKGCRGIGNAKQIDVDFHANSDSCPYDLGNWNTDTEKPVRKIQSDDPSWRITNKRKNSSKEHIDPRKFLKVETDIETEEPKLQTITSPQPQLQPVPTKTKQPVVVQPAENKPVNDLKPEIQVAKAFLCNYGPRLEQNYEIFYRNTDCLCSDDLPDKNPLHWTVDDTVRYLQKINAPSSVLQLFRHEEINGTALLALRQSDMTDILNIKIGPAAKIYALVCRLRGIVVTKYKDQ